MGRPGCMYPVGLCAGGERVGEVRRLLPCAIHLGSSVRASMRNLVRVCRSPGRFLGCPGEARGRACLIIERGIELLRLPAGGRGAWAPWPGGGARCACVGAGR